MLRLIACTAGCVVAASLVGTPAVSPARPTDEDVVVDSNCTVIRYLPDGQRIAPPTRQRHGAHGSAAISASGAWASSKGGASVSASSSSRGGRGSAVASSSSGGRTVTTTHNEDGCTVIIDDRRSGGRR